MESSSHTLGESSTPQYKWTEQDTEALIRWRIANERLFSGRRNATQKGFEEFVKDHSLIGKIDPSKIKRKWENLKQKYKELKAPRTGVSTEGGEATAASWRWYMLMDEAIGQRPSITPPVIIDSASQDAVVVSPPSQVADSSFSRSRRPEPQWIMLLKQMEERDEERERKCLEREQIREKEALEREERKEKEQLEREEKREREREVREEKRERERMDQEEKRERERMDREEKRERERMDREEKREKDWRDWLERRERENAEREDRRQREWLEVLERILK